MQHLIDNMARSGLHLGLICVSVAYILFFVAYFFIIQKGHRNKSYGASLLTITSQLAISVICIFGPYSWLSDLFYKVEEEPWVLGIWIAQAVVWAIVFVQYLVYGRRHPTRFPELDSHFHLIAWGNLILVTLTMWFFIDYSRDYYINTTWPLATLMMALGFFLTLRLRPKLRGLSLTGAWALTIATGLLYAGTVIGGLQNAYPCHAPSCFPDTLEAAVLPSDATHCVSECLEASGYEFIYWIYALGFILMFVYSWELTKRRHELHESWDVNDTLATWGVSRKL